MEYVGEKINSFTGNALSGINEMKRKRKQKQPNQEQPVEDAQAPAETGAIISFTHSNRLRENNNPLQVGFPFGGDTFRRSNQPAPPPIGFRTDFPLKSSSNDQQHQHSATKLPPSLPPSRGADESNRALEDSTESLYEGDAWTRVWFQRVMILTFLRLLLFIRKVYEDFQATKTYNLTGNTGHFLVSAATLFLPTIIFTVYRVTRYLQTTLPSTRDDSLTEYPSTKVKKVSIEPSDSKRGEDGQTTAALISSPSVRQQQQQVGGWGDPTWDDQRPDDDGLVTARQSPSNPQEYHDSKSQQDQALLASRTTSPAPSTAIVKDSPEQVKRVDATLKESVNIDKLVGSSPGRESIRVTIGASEQILHGILFVFWQLKRQVDVMGYLVERSCLWRKPKEQEKEELGRLRTGSDGLEWFQDFYAAFLAILAQVYTLGAHLSSGDKTPLHTSSLHSTSTGLGSIVSAEPPDGSISQTAKALSNAINQQLLAGNTIAGKDVLIMSQLVVSSAVVFSLLVAVRRRDDGPLTLALSMIGWGSIFASRIIIIALAFVHIGWKIMLPLIALHVLGITSWIYKIAIDSHNGKSDESEESKWTTEVSNVGWGVELEAAAAEVTSDNSKKESQNSNNVTSRWSALEHAILLSQILTLFALPSVFYWPIMFNLKLHYRPFKYLVLILSENFVLVAAVWFTVSSTATIGQWYLLGAVGGFSIMGFIFVSLYVCCKPSLTEYFARADELFNEAEKSGIYFEFCSRVFKMPDLGKHAFKRLMNQSEQVVEVVED